jgi:hypothetical protein
MGEGSTNSYSSANSAVQVSNPFAVSIVERTAGNQLEGRSETPLLTDECGFSFAQAFVVTYGKQKQEDADDRDPTNENERMLPIENMDKVFKMDYYAGSKPARRIYEVKIELDEDENPKKATLQKKPLEGEEGYREDPSADTLEQDGVLYIPVCETINESVTKIWLRDNIHLGGLGGGGGGNACVPWTPKVNNIGTAEVPKYQVTLNAGTINGIISAAWSEPIPIPNPIGTYYVLAEVSLTDGQVTSIDYSLSATVPTGDELNPTGVNSLPSSIKIILVTIFGVEVNEAPIVKACAVWSSSLYLESADIYHDPIENPKEGEAPYDIWYAYKVSGV